MEEEAEAKPYDKERRRKEEQNPKSVVYHRHLYDFINGIYIVSAIFASQHHEDTSP